MLRVQPQHQTQSEADRCERQRLANDHHGKLHRPQAQSRTETEFITALDYSHQNRVEYPQPDHRQNHSVHHIIKGPDGNALLVLAASSELLPLDLIKALIARGVDVNARNPKGETSLDFAARHGRGAGSLLSCGGPKEYPAPAEQQYDVYEEVGLRFLP